MYKHANVRSKVDSTKHEHKFVLGGRCIRCQIKESYLFGVIANLNQWPLNERQLPEWKEKVEAYMNCPAVGSQAYANREKSTFKILPQRICICGKIIHYKKCQWCGEVFKFSSKQNELRESKGQRE